MVEPPGGTQALLGLRLCWRDWEEARPHQGRPKSESYTGGSGGHVSFAGLVEGLVGARRPINPMGGVSQTGEGRLSMGPFNLGAGLCPPKDARQLGLSTRTQMTVDT